MGLNLLNTFSLILVVFSLSAAGINGDDGSTALVSVDHLPKEEETPNTPISDFDYKSYLERFGYMGYARDNLEKHNASEKEIVEFALKKYQTFYKIEPTGIFDQDTFSKMSLARCGNPDIYNSENSMAWGP